MHIYSINDEAFKKYGKVIPSPYYNVLKRAAEELSLPEGATAYKASEEVLESAEVVDYYSRLFGGLNVQIGYCRGENHLMNALEWHKSSEVHCALEDMILLLGDKREMEKGVFDTKNIKAFLVKKGESVEIYQTTLHFCPSMPDNKVFKNVVILPRGTNTPLTVDVEDKKLIARNKWLVCHPECKKHVGLGRVIGLIGENIVVK